MKPNVKRRAHNWFKLQNNDSRAKPLTKSAQQSNYKYENKQKVSEQKVNI